MRGRGRLSAPARPSCGQLLKGRPSASIHWQNIQMYIWGVAFNALGAYMKDGERLRHAGLLAGYSSAAWTVVVCNALNGLAISAVLKSVLPALACLPPLTYLPALTYTASIRQVR